MSTTATTTRRRTKGATHAVTGTRGTVTVGTADRRQGDTETTGQGEQGLRTLQEAVTVVLSSPSRLEGQLSPFAGKMLTALQRLTKEREPHPCGGFTTDDMQWRMGVAFTSDKTLRDSLEELTEAGLIQYAGYDEEDAIGSCYELRKGGVES